MDSKAEQEVPKSRSAARRLAVQSAPLNAVYNAADRGVAEALVKGSFKLQGPLKARCMQICELEGTEFSEFLRECCENLRTAYDGPTDG